jgi:hypothetical protein
MSVRAQPYPRVAAVNDDIERPGRYQSLRIPAGTQLAHSLARPSGYGMEVSRRRRMTRSHSSGMGKPSRTMNQ